MSLRLLGRLDEEFSCANSRFFRTTLYPHPQVRHLLRSQWVLHWQTVRDAPRLTVDFGHGRRLDRTITGNSAHLVLDARGRVIDAVPGLYSAQGFIGALNAARELAASGGPMAEGALSAALREFHGSRLERSRRAWARGLRADARSTRAQLEARTTPNDWQRLGGEVDLGSVALIAAKTTPDAEMAGDLAATKRMVEAPLLRAMRSLAKTIAEDTARNEYLLHAHIHEHFAQGLSEREAVAFTEWLYADVFLMPLSDPWLGLAPPDAFSALTSGGTVDG